MYGAPLTDEQKKQVTAKVTTLSDEQLSSWLEALVFDWCQQSLTVHAASYDPKSQIREIIIKEMASRRTALLVEEFLKQ